MSCSFSFRFDSLCLFAQRGVQGMDVWIQRHGSLHWYMESCSAFWGHAFRAGVESGYKARKLEARAVDMYRKRDYRIMIP